MVDGYVGKENDPYHFLYPAGNQAHWENDGQNLDDTCLLDEGAEQAPENPGDDSPNEILRSPRLEDQRGADAIARVEKMQPLLRGKEDSDERESSDKNDRVRPERTLRGVVSFDPGRRISPAGPGCRHELASQK